METAFSRRMRRFAPLFLVIGFALVIGGVVRAEDTVRKIPVARDRAGSEISVEIAPDGARRTATPSARLAGPVPGRAVERFEKHTGIDLGKSDAVEKLSTEAGKDNGELSARDAKSLLRALRDSLRGKRHVITREGAGSDAGKN